MKKLMMITLLISAGIAAQARRGRGLATAGLASSGRTGAAVVVGTGGRRAVRREAIGEADAYEAGFEAGEEYRE